MFNINDHKKNIIDAYVEVYGEEYRNIITDRINKQNIIVDISIKDLNRLIDNLLYNKLLDLNVDFYKAFVKSNKLDHLEELRPNIDSPYSIEDELPIFQFDGIESDLDEYIDDPSYEAIKSRMNSDEYKKCCQEIIEYRKRIGDFKEELVSPIEQKRKEDIEKKYDGLLYNKIMSILPDEVKTNRSSIQKYCKQPDIAQQLNKLKRIYKLACQKELLLTNPHVKDNPILQKLIENYTNKICSPLIGGRVCQLNMELDGEIQTLIVMPLSSRNDQSHDFTLVHELGHSITTNSDGVVGIENSNIMGNIEVNDINDYKRKYEVMNETLTNIFALRANRIMQKNNQFIFEDKSTSFNYGEEKDLGNSVEFFLEAYLTPLVDLIPDDVKKSMINSDQSYIRNKISDEKFEQLNDLINRRYAISHNFDISQRDADRQIIILNDELDKLYEEIKSIVKNKSNKIES